ncbi:RAD17 [Candida theae]|uniref:RAD17 n=1 Tax=Candida theae TaxID=1198502 RepID=A0AAD5FZR5_9ASCO|nr:RAD17 [Candida theae]KAI5962709.1 RAD17 [Candida theae]
MSLFVDSSQENGGDDTALPSQHTDPQSSPQRRNLSTWKPKPEAHFSASTNQIGHLSDVFQSLIAVNSQAIITIRSGGITIYSTYNYTINVHVNIDPALFSSYELTTATSIDQHSLSDKEGAEEEELGLRLGVDINLIANCFTSVLNTMKSEKSISCTITYKGDGHSLVIEFDDTLITERLDFYTFYIDEEELLENEQLQGGPGSRINYENVILEIMLKSDVLTNLLQDLYQIDTEILFIYSAEGVLNFISKGAIGMSKLMFPNEKSVMEKLHIDQSHLHIISQFRFAEFYKIFRAVKLSSKCKFIKDADGCFSIQLICKNHQQSGYPGTLLTINMTELDHDEHLIEWILQDEMDQIDNNKEQSLPDILPLTNIPRLDRHEPFINTFKRTSQTVHNNNNNNNYETRNGSKRSRQETGSKRKGQSNNVPLFL